MGSFFKWREPVLVVEVPMAIKEKWGYQIVINERATEDGKIRISVPGSDVPLMEIDVPQMAAAVQDEPTG